MKSTLLEQEKPASAVSAPAIDAALVWLMAITCGLVVANIYYNQPLLADIGNTFHLSDSKVSLIATATQIGYTLGLFLVVPLGDKVERKRLILLKLLCAAAAMALAAFAPSFVVLVVASVLIGIFSAVPQLLIPMAASLANDEDRGRIVGKVMSGLLIGILLSRTISGYVGAHFGWRTMFWAGSAAMVVLTGVLALKLPTSRPSFTGTYASLMKSLVSLTRDLQPLRRAALVGGFLFAGFSVFWTTLVFFLEGSPYHYGSDVVGFFGLIGACGALAAPLAGKAADKKGPDYAIRIGLLLALAAYAILGFGGYHLAGLVVGVIILDVGVQATHISNQSSIFALIPEARSRLNTVYMTAYFIGGSLGSLAGGFAWANAGWAGVSATGFSFVLAAFLINQLYRRKQQAR
ncbi:MFS transporter [Hymenobacter jejuensis]|uniref:MFS transporter n=1 Tax=Hymenobacter jejuensis TaxID=2502781 RepID=A0A5B7ZX58_9BACT|nr:MFS transporter [Hymenobacter jejuensis]QDA59457.1 MFS transporter [Hymenobacter jejuensis]